MMDLYHASRDELIRLVLAQQEALADQARQIARLEAELVTQRATIARLTDRVGEALGAGGTNDAPGDDAGEPAARGMPGLKPQQAPARDERPRKRRPDGFARHRMAPTAQQVHALDRCPHCGTRLAGGSIKRTREVLEVPVAPVVVTEHVYLERRCPGCGRRCVPPPELDGVVVGHSRWGIGLVSLIAVLREEARLPFATIQTLLRTLYDLQLSVGALVGAVATVARQGKAAVATMQTAIRASPVVHADESGWRQAGHNGYVWTFSTATHRYFVRDTREKRVLEEALGPDFAGVLVSDFYAAYTSYEGVHQYCWAHLLRDVHDVAQQHRRDAGVVGWADAVHAVFTRARAFASADPTARQQAARVFQADLAALCAPYLPAEHLVPEGTADALREEPPEAVPPQRVLCQRIVRYVTELFVFVADPAVPPTNNAAERSLRHLVVARKISGGTRSEAGSTAKMRLATLFGSWRAQGRNPFQECRQLLAAPQA